MDKLSEVLHEAGLTKVWLAESIGLKPDTVIRWQSDSSQYRLALLFATEAAKHKHLKQYFLEREDVDD